MLGALVALGFVGFLIFLIVDSHKRFEKLKEGDQEHSSNYRTSHALLMTIMIVLAISLLVLAGRELQKVN